MDQREALFSDIERSVSGGAWHGPSVREGLSGVMAECAAQRPAPESHSIWEILLHVVGWIEETASRVDGNYHTEPVGGDWPPAPVASAGAWAAARYRLGEALTKLRRSLDGLADEELDETVPPTEVTYRMMLAGLAQHNAYHAGQIMLIRKALAARQQAMAAAR